MSNFTRFRKTAVAAINNITLTELFARMWSNSDDETLAKLAGNYEIISEKCDDENFEDAVDTSSSDEDSPAMGSFINEPTEEAVDTEDMDTEGDDAEEVVDEAGENSGIFVES